MKKLILGLLLGMSAMTAQAEVEYVECGYEIEGHSMIGKMTCRIVGVLEDVVPWEGATPLDVRYHILDGVVAFQHNDRMEYMSEACYMGRAVEDDHYSNGQSTGGTNNHLIGFYQSLPPAAALAYVAKNFAGTLAFQDRMRVMADEAQSGQNGRMKIKAYPGAVNNALQIGVGEGDYIPQIQTRGYASGSDYVITEVGGKTVTQMVKDLPDYSQLIAGKPSLFEGCVRKALIWPSLQANVKNLYDEDKWNAYQHNHYTYLND